MSVTAHPRPAPRPRRASGCSQPRTAPIVLSARPAHPRSKPLAAAFARGLREACALDVFTALERELERQIGAPAGAPSTSNRTEDHDD